MTLIDDKLLAYSKTLFGIVSKCCQETCFWAFMHGHFSYMGKMQHDKANGYLYKTGTLSV